jgi:hypothetical protein
VADHGPAAYRPDNPTSLGTLQRDASFWRIVEYVFASPINTRRNGDEYGIGLFGKVIYRGRGVVESEGQLVTRIGAVLT